MTNPDFRKWFSRNLKEYAHDIACHGADAGFPHITYTTDTVKIYNRYRDQIWDWLREDAESFGLKSVPELLATFRRQDMLNDEDQMKNLLVWYACERIANEYEV